MKYIRVIFVIAIIHTHICNGSLMEDIIYEVGKSMFNDKLEEFLTSLKPVLKTGNSNLGIPILDPYETVYQKIIISEDIMNIEVDMSNVKVTGLSNYTVNKAKFEGIGLNMILNVTWFDLVVKSLYSLEAEYKGITLNRKGAIDIRIFDLTVTANAHLHLKSNNKLSVKSLSTNIHSTKILFDSSGLCNDQPVSETINSIISNAGHYILNNLHQWPIRNQIDCRLKKLINSYLDDFILPDIINIIG